MDVVISVSGSNERTCSVIQTWETHTKCESNDEVHEAWTRLARTPFEHPAWLLTWWEHFGSDGELRIVVGRDEAGQIRGLAPLYRDDHQLRLLGDGVACSDHQQLLIGVTDENQTAKFVESLVERPDFSQSQLSLESIDCESTTATCLEKNTRTLTLTSEAVGSAYIDLCSDWESYLSSLSKNHRKRCRRWWRKHFESNAIQRISTRDGWNKQSAMQTLTNLHKQRRQALRQSTSDSFSDPQFIDFLTDAFNRLSRHSVTTGTGVSKPMAEISGLLCNDKVIAAEFELHSASSVNAYQSGMCPEHQSESIGSVSVLSRIRRAIEDGQVVYDFGRGLEEYKFHWGSKALAAADYRVWPATVGGRVRSSSQQVLQTAKQVARFARDLVLAK